MSIYTVSSTGDDMNLLLFGATGATGRELLKQALSAGHSVTAFVRNKSKLQVNHSALSIEQGDVLDSAAVEATTKGKDGVLCAIGASPFNKERIRERGTRNIVAAMEKHHVQRLICQSSLGFGDSESVLPPFMRYILVPFILKKAFQDHEKQEAVIRRSSLDWTIVRPGNLTNGPQTGNYLHGFPSTGVPITLKISRADVADFMLKQLDSPEYLHQTAGISY